MSAIITKYRPKTFDEVVGQDNAVGALQTAIKLKAAHAYLFSGPSGVGKTTLARLAAKALACDEVEEEDGATNTGIENVRSIIEGLAYRPLGGTAKGIIIDECHALSKAAIQALLKTLEDPPGWIYFFLCTTEPTKLPETIRTRCLHFSLKEVSTNDLTTLLESIDEGMKVGREITSLCVREANGSPRQALANLGICLGAESRKEAAELLRSAVDAPQAIDLARGLLAHEPWARIQGLFRELKDTSPESIRQVVRSYMTKVVLGEECEPFSTKVITALAVMEAFSKPFPTTDGISPVVLACCNLFSDE